MGVSARIEQRVGDTLAYDVRRFDHFCVIEFSVNGQTGLVGIDTFDRDGLAVLLERAAHELRTTPCQVGTVDEDR